MKFEVNWPRVFREDNVKCCRPDDRWNNSHHMISNQEYILDKIILSVKKRKGNIHL